MYEWFEAWAAWIVGASFTMFFFSFWFASWLIIRLPHDFFLRDESQFEYPHPVIHLLLQILRNVVGAVLIAAGAAMLVLPGQGVLTILLGVSLMSFPGKREIVRWILQRKSIRKTINWVRGKAGRPPIVFDRNLTFQSPAPKEGSS